jgi:hypothetical protein
MLVDDLDFIGIAVCPSEADPPLVVHADAVLSAPTPFNASAGAIRRASREVLDV